MEKIVKQGIVEAVADKKLRVAVISCSACHQCQARSFCGLSDEKQKEIEVETDNAARYKRGDKVTVYLSARDGLKAVGLGYALPLVLLVGTAALVSLSGYDDFISGISAIIVLIPYYFGLFLLKKKLRRAFCFRLED